MSRSAQIMLMTRPYRAYMLAGHFQSMMQHGLSYKIDAHTITMARARRCERFQPRAGHFLALSIYHFDAASHDTLRLYYGHDTRFLAFSATMPAKTMTCVAFRAFSSPPPPMLSFIYFAAGARRVATPHSQICLRLSDDADAFTFHFSPSRNFQDAGPRPR